MSTFTRREILQLLSSAIPIVIGGCKRKDVFEEERVCVHVFDPKEKLPVPLLEQPQMVPLRVASRDYFEVGLPELVLCTTSTKFIELFQYFWPISQAEFRQMQESISVKFARSKITGAEDIDQLAEYLRDNPTSVQTRALNLALIFTYNECTQYWSPVVIEACRKGSVNELVIIKDPTRAPYLCDYASQQKGFKRPPP